MSPATRFMDDGLAVVWANCVFSSVRNSGAFPLVRMTRGRCPFGADSVAAVGWVGDGTFFDSEIIASISLGLTPSFCRARRASGEMSYFAGLDWIAEITTGSGRPPFTILTTSALVSGLAAWPNRVRGRN